MPGQTVFEKDDAYTTVSSSSIESIVGRSSPLKRMCLYGSSSKIVKRCSAASASSSARLGCESV